MSNVKRKKVDSRAEVTTIENKITAGVKKRQAAAETLDATLTVQPGDATTVRKGRR